ncbi:MAG: PAS domain S-box protein, partial [Clostridia bacterium]|nr:PAS domain S-box protein [Deltaproteobacteria bacterium]
MNADYTPVPAEGSANKQNHAPRAAPGVVLSAIADAPISILIVDDEPKNLTVLETLLDAPGYRLVRAESADQALLALVAEEFALLILDIRMPDMTGFELAQTIKGRKKTARVPIIFLTAYYNEDQHVLEGYDSGAVDYLQKPVNAAVLRSKVAVFAELYRKGRDIANANRALLAEVTERRRAEEQLRELNEELDRRVTERTLALSASDARLRLATDAVGLGIWTWQMADDAWLWENAWPFTILGVARADAPATAARIASEFVHPDDRTAFEQAIGATLEGGVALRFEGRVRRPDGSLRWVEFVGDRVAEPKGAGRVLGTVRDITERLLAEHDRRESEARYRTLFHSIDEGFCVVEMLFDASGRPADFNFLECNLAFERHSGLSGPVGKRVLTLLPALEAEWLELFGRVATSGESVRRSGKIQSLSRFVEVYAFRLGGVESSRVAILFRDITEQNRAEETLRERERFLRTVTGAARIGLAVIEPGDVYRFANEAYAQMLGRSSEAIIGQPVREVVAVGWALDGSQLDRAFAGERVSFDFTLAALPEDGRLRHFGAFLEPHLDHQGLRTVAVVVIEITDLKQMESELRDTDRRKDE